jgi:hypothetical protein
LQCLSARLRVRKHDQLHLFLEDAVAEEGSLNGYTSTATCRNVESRSGRCGGTSHDVISHTARPARLRVLLHDTKLRRAKVPPAIRGCLLYYKLQTSLRNFNREGVLRMGFAYDWASQITNLDNFGKNRYGLVQPYRLRHNFRLAQQSRPGVLSWSLCIATPVNCYHLRGLHHVSYNQDSLGDA